jgi:tRNA nucleotidyltransferase (CCA-adding enzyme)
MKSSLPLDKFERLGISIGLDALNDYHPVLRYADHPYVEGQIERTRINVVPCYDVQRGAWISAADRSPFHTRYVNEVLDVTKKNQVRILKVFLKSVGIYGAEIATAGFSGYVSEVLVANYGSFLAVLSAISDFKHRQVIALSDYDPDVVKGFQSAMIIIDPIDPRRNLGTAISNESTASFILSARAFLGKPSEKYFTNKRFLKPTKLLYPNVLIIEFSHKQRSPDVVWGQLKRTTAAVAKQLAIAGFSVIRSSCITDEKTSAAMAFLLESLSLPAYVARAGPEVFRRTDTSKFLENIEKNAQLAWVDKDMRTWILVKRKATSAEAFVKSLFGGARNINSNNNSGISSDLVSSPNCRNTVKIYSGKKPKLSNLVRHVVEDVAATERLLFN